MQDEREFLKMAVPPLLAWYRENKREMPWRDEPTPYHVWISEIMLQQTRIEAVIPYYRRFLRELPDVRALAAVSDDKLMKLWEGLGYYSRARNLKKAAVFMVSEYNGQLPQSFVRLRALPGIGDYTAGAISSIAFGLPEPAVDGNVLRVVTRLTACAEDVMQEKTRKSVSGQLRDVYPCGEDASSLTQAWMELGEVVCLPNGTPRCGQCPLRELCRARREGRETDFPVKSPKKERKIQQKTVALLTCKGRVAIRKRGEGGLLAGTWEFWNTDGRLDERQLCVRLEEQGVTADFIYPCGSSVHIFTHVEWHMEWYRVECAEENSSLVWVTAEEIARNYAVPTAFRHYRKLIGDIGQKELQ